MKCTISIELGTKISIAVLSDNVGKSFREFEKIKGKNY